MYWNIRWLWWLYEMCVHFVSATCCLTRVVAPSRRHLCWGEHAVLSGTTHSCMRMWVSRNCPSAASSWQCGTMIVLPAMSSLVVFASTWVLVSQSHCNKLTHCVQIMVITVCSCQSTMYRMERTAFYTFLLSLSSAATWQGKISWQILV